MAVESAKRRKGVVMESLRTDAPRAQVASISPVPERLRPSAAAACAGDQIATGRVVGSSCDDVDDAVYGVGAPTNNWVMCYPYGAYNDTLLRLLRDRGCAIGLTIRVAVANPGTDDPLALPRLDTNDLPV